MALEIDSKEILSQLKKIRAELSDIKKYIELDKLTEQEKKALAEARAEYNSGTTTSLEDFETEFDD